MKYDADILSDDDNLRQKYTNTRRHESLYKTLIQLENSHSKIFEILGMYIVCVFTVFTLSFQNRKGSNLP